MDVDNDENDLTIEKLHQLLVEGYQLTREEDILIAAEFQIADFENFPDSE